jgi:uncharacterized protein YjbJ (UPF0337 family)
MGNMTSPFKETWNKQKSKLKAKFPTLTDEDLHYEEELREEMFNKIQVKLGKTEEELASIMSSL